jgi:hypothetical protein
MAKTATTSSHASKLPASKAHASKAQETKQPRLRKFKARSTRANALYYERWGGSKIKRDRKRARELRQHHMSRLAYALAPRRLFDNLPDDEIPTPKIVRILDGLKELSFVEEKEN